jgi:hypothetical protein
MCSRLLLLAVIFVLLWGSVAFGWGEDGHSYINRVAVKMIPASMPSFLKAADNQIAYLGPEPDRWRRSSEFALKEAQDPDHFIDLERVSWLQEFPLGRYEFYRMLNEKRVAAKDSGDDFLPERVGLQPYITIEIYDRLKVAFREYRRLKAGNTPTEPVEHNAIFYAGWLGHYVGDGAQPLHTTVNYDGWVEANPHGYRTERGIHAEFETAFVSRNIGPDDFASLVRPPHQLTDPFRDYLQYLVASHAQVERVYQLDKEGGFRGDGSPATREFVKQRLAAGSQMLVDLWYTAWQVTKD